MKEKLSKVIKTVKKAPQKKHHLDFIVAILTIPVLLSVIFLNYSNLQKNKTSTIPNPSPTQNEKQVIVIPQKDSSSPAPTSSTCKKEIGPVNISSPKEGGIISDNPVCITVNYNDTNYCSVVWSYRINNGTWSDYNSGNPCIYNLPNGNIKFDLKIQSTVTQEEQTITRNFIYRGSSSTTATGSAITQ